mmetsp:Transcript_48054/g.88522  ORF Transcript_48054/g.88522 Transcript_48054/m.88522 type:complete len:493 (-) Transcript_48054:122-1600(-)
MAKKKKKKITRDMGWSWCLAVPVAFIAVVVGMISLGNFNLEVCNNTPIASFKVEDLTLGVDKVVKGSDTLARAYEHSLAIKKNTSIINHASFADEVRNAMRLTGFTLVMGPKNVGKTKILKSLCVEDSSACLYVDGRLQRNLALALFHGLSHPEATAQSIMSESSFQNAAFGHRVEETKDRVYPSFVIGVGRALYGHSNVGVERRAYFAQRWPDMEGFFFGFDGGKSQSSPSVSPLNLTLVVPDAIKVIEHVANRLGRFTLILDEARRILDEAEANNDDLASLVSLAKQNSKVTVLMASSEGALPYDLQNFEAFRREDIERYVYATELPEVEMQSALMNWGATEVQADQMTRYLGGHFFAVNAALEAAGRGRSLHITSTRPVADAQSQAAQQIGKLSRFSLADRRQRKLMAKLAEQGWVPVRDHNAAEVQALVQSHIAFLLSKPFPEYVLPAGVPDDVLRHEDYLLLPSSKIMKIALRDGLCKDPNMWLQWG